MTDDRAAFTEARDAGKAIHQAQRLENATYTAVEVKALTKTATDLAYALGRKEAAGISVSSLPEHLQGDGPCSNCGTRNNPTWFTESVFWNAVVRVEPRLTDHTEILCIPCFIIMADERGYRCHWRLLPEWHWETKAEAAKRREDAS